MPVISRRHFGGVSEKKHSLELTRNALAARNNDAYGQGNGRESFVLYSPSLLDTGILLLAVLILELEMNYPSETSLCTVATSPTDTHSPIFSEGRGRLYTGYLKRIIHLQTARQK